MNITRVSSVIKHQRAAWEHHTQQKASYLFSHVVCPHARGICLPAINVSDQQYSCLIRALRSGNVCVQTGCRRQPAASRNEW
jgi:hypothetical protein